VTTTLPSDHEVTVRYWAGARAATGVASDVVTGGTVADVVAAAVALHPALRPVVAVATFLLDGSAAPGDRAVPAGATVEVLPPFAGG
jgi:molybdopterin converting factor small subunit